MSIRKALAALALTCATALIGNAAVQAQSSAPNWNNTVAKTQRGHRVGNPDAPIQLIAFESYSCPACRRFERESEAVLKMNFIHEGRAALEIRTVIHHPIDLAASLAVQCGPVNRFVGNHQAMFRAQEQWLAKATQTSRAQQQRWYSGVLGQRMRAIASDLDFYELMEPRGYSRTELDRCLGDEAKAIALANNAAADGVEFAIPGTPSFAINGSLVANTHTWDGLRPALAAAGQ